MTSETVTKVEPAVEVTVEVTLRRIADLMCSAIESGQSRCWCLGLYLKTPSLQGHIVAELAKAKRAEGDTGIWYNLELLYARDDLAIEVLEDETECGDNNTAKRHLITKESLRKGLALMAQKFPRHFGDFMDENDDAITADIFLQCVVLGEEKYG